MELHNRPAARKRSGAALAVLLAWQILYLAHAATPTFGVSIIPFTGGWPEAMLTASVPFSTYESNEGPIVFAARLDISAPINFSHLPTVGLAATGMFTSNDMFQPFFGIGAALGWARPPEAQYLYVTPTVLAGLRVPLNPTWGARVDAVYAPLRSHLWVGIGVDLALD